MTGKYEIALFIHILSAFTLYSLWFFEFMLTLKAESKNSLWQPVVERTNRFQMASMLMVLLSGFYQMQQSWGPRPWLVVSVILFLSTIPVSIFLSVALKQNEKSDSTVQTSIPFIRSVYKIGVALVILILMVFKNSEYDQAILVVMISALFISGIAFRCLSKSGNPRRT